MARITEKFKQVVKKYNMKDELVCEKPPYYFENTVGVTCDICGEKGQRENDWSNSIYDVEETEVCIKYKSGESYPEGGNTKTIEYDICPKCFIKVLKPFLESKGCSAVETETDW